MCLKFGVPVTVVDKAKLFFWGYGSPCPIPLRDSECEFPRGGGVWGGIRADFLFGKNLAVVLKIQEKC